MNVANGIFLNYARQKLVVRHYFIIFVAKYATFCVAHCRTLRYKRINNRGCAVISNWNYGAASSIISEIQVAFTCRHGIAAAPRQTRGAEGCALRIRA